MIDSNKVLSKEETLQVSGGGISGAIDGAGAISDGIVKILDSAGLGVDGLTRPSPAPKDGKWQCCGNHRRI